MDLHLLLLQIRPRLRHVARAEWGQVMTEGGLILGLLSVIAMAAVTTLGRPITHP